MTEPRLLVLLCSLSVLCGQTAAANLCGSFVNSQTARVGTAVSVSAICYSNGSAVYTWSSAASQSVRRVQIEYQCCTDTVRKQSSPVAVLCWSSIRDGSRVVNNISNGNATCTFSGCYETSFFTKYLIQNTTCTLPVTPPPSTARVVTVNFESATYQVPENNGSVCVCVMKDREVEESFSVEVTSIPQTAQGSLQPDTGDFLLVTRTVTFTGDQQTSCVSIPITDDNRHEPPENFTVSLGMADGVKEGVPSVATVTIMDDDDADHDQELFQIQLGPVEYCISWNSKTIETIEGNIRNALAEVIVNQCKCKFPLSNIPTGQFSCRTTTTRVTYRSTILGTAGYNASQLLDILQSWVTSGATIKVEQILLGVYVDCPVHISLLSDPECPVSEPTALGDPTLITSDRDVIQCVNICLLDSQK